VGKPIIQRVNRIDTRWALRSPEADHTHQPAGEWAFLAVAEEKIGAAGRAEIAGKDILCAHASGEKLRAVGLAKIEMDILWRRLVTGRHHVEPLQRIGLFAGASFIEIVGGISELRGEFRDKLRANFITTGADGRADGGEEIGWIAAEFKLHAARSFLGDARQGAAPAGVHCGDGAFFWINEQNGHAIRGLYGQKHAGGVCGGAVAPAGLGRR